MRLPVVLLGFILVACGSAPPSASPSGNLDVEGSWRLVSGRSDAGDVPILDDHPITLTITGTEASGTAACNHYGGRFVVRDGRLAIDELGMTAMGCEAPVAAAEAAYIEALGMVSAIGRDGDDLVLRGDAVELRFEPLPAPPTADLVDSVWVLDTVFAGDVASAPMGDRATLELRSDGTFSGATGCRTFDGQWVVNGEQILATSMSMNELECPADLAGQDSHVVSVIGDGFVPTIEGDLLTLTDPGGVGLVYRVAE